MYVVIVEFGEKSATLISECLYELDVSNEIVGPDDNPPNIYTHIILSGGPKHVYSDDHYKMPSWVITSPKPVLCICYGMQLLAHIYGGKVIEMKSLEKGIVLVNEIIDNKFLLKERWMNRKDRVYTVPYGFHITGYTQESHIASFTDKKKWWAVQYHPESRKGRDLGVFVNFLKNKMKK